MTPKEHLIAALKALCSREGGHVAVADEIKVNDQTIWQIINGVKLPSGAPRGVGPKLQAALDGRYPGWANLAAPPPQDELTEVAPPPPTQMRRVPIVGTAKMGDDGFYDEISDMPGAGDGHIEIATADPNAYGLRCRGMSMFPAVRDGWYVVVEPNRRPTEGEYVLIKLLDGRKMLKELLFERTGSYEVMSVNQSHRFTVEKADLDSIQAVGPIVPPSAWRPV